MKEEEMKDFVKCEICGKTFKGISKTHLNHKHGISFDEYFKMFPEAKIRSEKSLFGMRNKLIGRDLHWKDKIAKAVKQSYDDDPEGWGRTGVPASDETKRKVSLKIKGLRRTPEQKAYISKRTKENHICRKDPEKWKKIMKDRYDNLDLDGSKSQRYAYRYLSKYFGIFHKIKVEKNDFSPFAKTKRAFSVDFSIPKYKIAVEWDGLWHRDHVIKKLVEIFYKRAFLDVVKNSILRENGWKIVRVEYGDEKDYAYKKETKRLCRILIKSKLVPLITDPEFYSNFKNEYALSKERFAEVKEEYKKFKEEQNVSI